MQIVSKGRQKALPREYFIRYKVILIMEQEESTREVARQLEMEWNEQSHPGIEDLASRVNELISGDFPKLINILYRLDVSESKLRAMLSSGSGEDAGLIIARLMFERQLQKIRSRRDYREENKDGEDRW
jgi:hypothetical protein